MTAERAVMYVKKVTYFGKFCYLNSSCIRKRITLMFMRSSRINSRFSTKTRQQMFLLASVAMLVPIQVGTRVASPYKSL